MDPKRLRLTDLPPVARTRSIIAVLAAAAVLPGCTVTVESSTSYTGSTASQAIQIGGYNTEPSGYVYAQVLTSLGVAARDPAATWQSIGAFPVSTTPIWSGGEDYFAWDGTLTNFTTATWPTGGVARVRILFPQGGSYTTGFTFDDFGCLLANLNEGDDYQQVAIDCQGHDSGYLHLVDEDPVRDSTRDYISLRETPTVSFQGQIVNDPAADYYAVVDSASTRTTLADWQFVNGFDGFGGSLPGYEPVVEAAYFNKSDLELGRRMNCVKKLNSTALACYVTNYGDPAAAFGPGPQDSESAALAATIAEDPAGLVATVAMEYRPNDPANRVTFFAFDPAGNRANAVELDSEGKKNMPGACLSCHGGRFSGLTDSVAGAHFLPFDVDNFSYSTTAGYTLATQQDAFRALNKLVLDAGPTPAIIELVDGWYGGDLGGTGPDQDTEFVPSGWKDQEVVYQEVVKPYCRGCHVALDDPAVAAPISDFNTYAELNNLRFSAMTRICELYDMPHAEVIRNNFWASPARGHLIGEFQLPTACP